MCKKAGDSAKSGVRRAMSLHAPYDEEVLIAADCCM